MNLTTQPTAHIADRALTALVTHRYSDAVALLEELGRRDDNSEMFLTARSYRVPEHLVQLVQDRLDLVNAKAN